MKKGHIDFLQGKRLTEKVRQLCAQRVDLKIASAYWGADAINLLQLNPRKSNAKILCCLRGGKSDPHVIQKFGARARQNDKLHAKVIWTSRGAIVSSANASSNGLPEEEHSAIGLIEAGVLFSDNSALLAIERWFDAQYKAAKRITRTDLQNAQIDRDRRLWESAAKPLKRSLIDALRTGGRTEFAAQRISLIMFKLFTTPKEDSMARQFIKHNSQKLESTFSLPHEFLRNLTWYTDWNNLPTNSFLISCEMWRKRITTISLHKHSMCHEGGRSRGCRIG